MVLGLLRVREGWHCKGRREIEWRVCVRLRGGRMWRPVLVPPPLLSSQPSPLSPQPVSGSLPPPPADFSLGGSEKNCPLSLSPTAAAWELPCPPDINQHTHTHSFKHTHTLSPASSSDGQAGGQPSLLLALTCKWDIQPLREAGEGQDIRKVLLGGNFVFIIWSCVSDCGDAKCAAGWFCISLACFEINSKKLNYIFDKYCTLWIIKSEQYIWPVMAFCFLTIHDPNVNKKGRCCHKKIQEWNLLSPSNWLTGFFCCC